MDNGFHELEVSVVLLCLNEAETLRSCIDKIRSLMSDAGLKGEVIVADNGSVDGSVQLAEKMGASIVRVEERGYGNALLGGISAARGKYVIMGDADDSY